MHLRVKALDDDLRATKAQDGDGADASGKKRERHGSVQMHCG
jgi:hypothetical protein